MKVKNDITMATAGVMDRRFAEAASATLVARYRTTTTRYYFQVSPKLLGFGEACPGVLKVSCCGVASWALRFGDKCVNDLDLL